MKKKIFTIAFSMITSFSVAQNTTISEILASQRNDGSMIVDVYYKLQGPDPTYIIDAEVSFDNGNSFQPIDSVSGDIGPGVIPGTGKHLVWKFGKEFPLNYSYQTKFKINGSINNPWNCGDELIDSRDNQVYPTVQIGNQCWLQRNMNLGTMIQAPVNMTNNNIFEKYCYGNLTINCDIYGGLYQWNEMMQYVTLPGTQGICPPDWYIPTDADWNILVNFLGGSSIAGGKMKEAGTAHWLSPNIGATNSSGFTALPGGNRGYDAIFRYINIDAYIWSSTQNGSIEGWARKLVYYEQSIQNHLYEKVAGFSVRCIKE